MQKYDAHARAVAHHPRLTLCRTAEKPSFSRALMMPRPERCGNLGMSGNAEHRDQRVIAHPGWELLQIQDCCLLEVGQCFINAFPFAGSARLRVIRHVPPFFSGGEDSGELYGCLRGCLQSAAVSCLQR